MATHLTPGGLPVDDVRYAKTPTRVSWGAIFAGVVLAIAVQLVLGILGTGIGLSLVDPVEGTTPGAAGFGIGAGIYWVITTVIALGAGGYAAARVAGVHDRFDGLVHGLVASAAGTGIGAAAPKVADVANVDVTDVREEAAEYLSDAPSDPALMTPEQAQKEIAKQLPALARGGQDGAQAESRIVDIVAAQRKISRPEAQAQVTRAKAQFVKTKNDTIETAKSATDAAAGAAAGTSFMVVIALLIGAAAAGFGATAAARRRV